MKVEEDEVGRMWVAVGGGDEAGLREEKEDIVEEIRDAAREAAVEGGLRGARGMDGRGFSEVDSHGAMSLSPFRKAMSVSVRMQYGLEGFGLEVTCGGVEEGVGLALVLI